MASFVDMRRSLIILAWILTVSAAAPLASSTSHAAVTYNRLATNRLATNRLSTNRLATNRLATNKLATNVLVADPSAQELLSTPEGRDLYSYIVSCALPAGVTIVATVDGTPYEFPGSVGLAPRWLKRKLSKSGQGWVSACLLARVNAHDTVEPISIRGKNPALATSPSELVEFSLQEGAFYGNVFASDADPPDWNACRGQDQAQGETGGLVDRDCAEPDALLDPTHTQCGFNYAGDCADYTPVIPTPYACRAYDPTGVFFISCHAQPAVKKWPHAKTYRQVITTFVKP
jgi:hypothetical protein